MIDLKDLRDNPGRYREGCEKKQIPVDIDRVLELDSKRRALLGEQEALRAEQNRLAKETGPMIGQLMGRLKQAEGEEKAALEAEVEAIKAAPARLKEQIQGLDEQIAAVTPRLESLLLAIPLPPDPDVPVGQSADDNVEVRRWAPEGWDWDGSFEANRGFAPRTHMELCDALGLVDFPRGVKIAGTRSYILTGDGMRLHNAVLRYAFDFMAEVNGFTPMSVPVIVREEAMVGTGFFPAGREQAYHIEESTRGSGHDLFLTGTGEVGLMGLHQGEILDEAALPLRYVTVSTCFRREAGAAGKDTAGLYRIHQFDKVEQVVICRADEAESRAWHQKMIGFVEAFLQSLGLPYRLLQCCTADLGPKNADMIDIECWMPGRSALRADNTGRSALRADNPGRSALRADNLDSGSENRGTQESGSENRGTQESGSENRSTQESGSERRGTQESGSENRGPQEPTGAFGETHSASRLYDFQCRRLNMRYRPGGEAGREQTRFCHSLNNTVAASPRILIPLLEMHQNADGSVTIPPPLRPYMNGRERIG